MELDVTLPDLNKRNISLYGSIDAMSVKSTIDAIMDAKQAYDDFHENYDSALAQHGFYRNGDDFRLTLNLSTPGGYCYDGLGLCDLLSKYDVTCICSGYIMSMGIPILLSCKHRKAYKNTTFMIHAVSSITMGKLDEMKDDVKETERLNDIIDDIIIANSGITKSRIKEMHEKKQDWFMSAEEALKLGLIDEIIG